MTYLLIVLLLSGSQAEVLRLTGVPGFPSGTDFGDPSVPNIVGNEVHVYTTGGEKLVWKSKKDFLKGAPARHEEIIVFHDDGETQLDVAGAGEDIWDPTIEYFPGQNEPILFGSIMFRREGERFAYWPEDHWSRRTFAFKNKNGRWVREKESLFGPRPPHPRWLDHNYGHHFIQDNGRIWMFYERVADDDGRPWITELFARELYNGTQLVGPEITIFEIPSDKPWPSAVRGDGTLLVEGPRPFKVGDRYLLSFSAGDFYADDYGIHLLWADHVTGPYRPILNEDGDFKNFSEDIEKELPLKRGAARGAFFEMDGKWYVLFHGIPQNADTQMRDVFLAPVKIDMRGQIPKVRINP